MHRSSDSLADKSRRTELADASTLDEVRILGLSSRRSCIRAPSDGQAKDMRNIVDIIAPLSSNEAEFVSIAALISHILRDYASELGSPAEGARFWCAWLTRCNLTSLQHKARDGGLYSHTFPLAGL